MTPFWHNNDIVIASCVQGQDFDQIGRASPSVRFTNRAQTQIFAFKSNLNKMNVCDIYGRHSVDDIKKWKQDDCPSDAI